MLNLRYVVRKNNGLITYDTNLLASWFFHISADKIPSQTAITQQKSGWFPNDEYGHKNLKLLEKTTEIFYVVDSTVRDKRFH